MYADHDYATEKRMLKSFVVIRGESEEWLETWLIEVLLMFSCAAKVDTNAAELASVQSTRCAVPLDDVNEALGCIFLQWAAAGHGEKESNLSLLGEGSVSVVAGEWFELLFSEYLVYCACCWVE